MHTYNNLFPIIAHPEALLQAWDEFKKDKRKKLDVQMFEFRLEDNLFSLLEEISNKTYRHGPYSPFYIRDPKIRLIHKAQVRDRVVHHLLFRVLEPIFDRGFIHHSYSCRLEKGTHKGVEQLSQMSRKIYQNNGSCFALKCDVKQFFPSIDHKVLYEILSRKIEDESLLWLIRTVIESFDSSENVKAHAATRERERVRAARSVILHPNSSQTCT